MDENLKDKRKQLEGAINDALAESPAVADLIQEIRKQGYDVFLIIEATVGFSKRGDGNELHEAEASLELTSQDRSFLRSLKIKPE